MNNALFLNGTSFDTIAVFMPKVTTKFYLPITLSTGTGKLNFIEFEDAQPNLVMRPTINNRLISYGRMTIINGQMTLHAQSLAITAIREILEYQASTRIKVTGTLYVLNFQALQFDQYKEFSFTSPYTGADRGKILSDVKFKFSSLPATGLSAAFANMILNKIL